MLLLSSWNITSSSSHFSPLLPLMVVITLQMLILITTYPPPIGCQFVGSDQQQLVNGTESPPAAVPQQQQFWVSTVVEQIHFRKECISSQLCAEPRFSLVHQMPKYNERFSRDWALAKAEVPAIPLEFFTFWGRGMPSDVTIQAFVHGIDPKFKFSRICDESSFVSVFQFVVKPNNDYYQQQNNAEMRNEMVQLELHAQCFNTTLTAQLFRHRCPWCLDEHAQQKSSAAYLTDTHQQQASLLCQVPLQFRTNLLIVLLAIATGINVLAFVGLLCICERQRRTNGTNSSSSSSSNNSNSKNNYERAERNRSGHQRFSAGQIVFPRVHHQQHYHPPSAGGVLPKSRHPAAMRTQQHLLPTISEEFYEVIDDESNEARPNVPLHFTHKSSKCCSSLLQQQPKMVQLPLSSKCDHCLLRVQPGDERGSCGSLDTSIESNFGNNSLTEEPEDENNEFSKSSNIENLNANNDGAMDSGLDGSNHTEEEQP